MPKLTKRLIDATPCPIQGQSFLRDDEVRGFALRLTTGAKTFILEKRIDGRVRRMTIGPYGPLTLVEARMRANVWIGQISKGANPAQEVQEAKCRLTFQELWDEYIERHGPRKKTLRNDICLRNKHLALWDNWQITSITRGDVARLHGKIGKTAPYSANRVITLLRVMFNLAEEWGYFKGENPASKISLFPEEKRDRFVRKSEFPALINALGQEPNPFIRGFFIVCLFTGARKSEVLSMKWADVDFDELTWRIPNTKTGRPHTLPLARPVVFLLRALPKVGDNPHVFPSYGKSGHLADLTKAWARVKDRAGLHDVRIHDLRRTLGSWMVGAGASLPLIGKVLNHSRPSTTAIYARLPTEAVRKALEDNAERMVSIGGGLLEANAQKMIEIGGITIEGG